MSASFIHKSVLLQEAINGLGMTSGDIYLDGTLGSAGHTEAAINAVETVGGKITVIGLDRDHDAIIRAGQRLGVSADSSGQNHTDGKKTIMLCQANYRDLDTVLDGLHISKVNRIMLDLGLSSDQFETSRRGFSFKEREPLLMTFEKHLDLGRLTAKEIINEWDEANLADIIYGYGEERYARRIARKIVEARETRRQEGGGGSINTTHDLVELIKKATPFTYHRGRIHPATRTFQALRIAVNDEFNALKDGLRKGFDRLAPGGRMAIISFHSLEDRLVKHFYKEQADAGKANLITKRPIVPTDKEVKENPRSRSAKLRIIEKI